MFEQLSTKGKIFNLDLYTAAQKEGIDGKKELKIVVRDFPKLALSVDAFDKF